HPAMLWKDFRTGNPVRPFYSILKVLVTSAPLITTLTANALPWSVTTAPTNYTFISACSSADGKQLCIAGGPVFMSTDSGATWVSNSALVTDWVALASSADGTKLVGLTGEGEVYRSANSGVSWMSNSLGTSGSYASLASSADGGTVIAGI